MNLGTEHPLVTAVLADSQSARAGALERFCASASYSELELAIQVLAELGSRPSVTTYQQVRIYFLLYAIYRYYLPPCAELQPRGQVPVLARTLMLACRYQEAIDVLLDSAKKAGLSDPIASALAAAYYGLGFQVLAAQVQRSVRSICGNRWMFRVGHTLDYPLRIRPELIERDATGKYPVLVEDTPVRLDLCHSGWSDIFFLGMDFPEGARVLNISVDLAIVGRDSTPTPPIRCFFRVIEQPVLRVVSVDLGASADFVEVGDIFDFGRDYLGLLKAALVASGIVPSGLEGSHQSLVPLLEALVGPGRGIELVSHVNGIPKGSRLAVSTNLLGGLIAVCMRATGQLANLTGTPSESERRLVAGRAILGEWLGGSGGGWQDSGGLWPGIKTIEGVVTDENDVEFRSSRGRLMPSHQVLGVEVVPASSRIGLQASLVMVHGGLSANVGPILEMVTERFLIANAADWSARQHLMRLFEEIRGALTQGDIQRLGRLTTEAFEGPLRAIIPWVTNAYTERLIQGMREHYAERFWGFCMLGGMSGGGMGFLFAPEVRNEAEAKLVELMQREKGRFDSCLPFAMTPCAYRVAINEVGTTATLRTADSAVMSAKYYLQMLPKWFRSADGQTVAKWRSEIDALSGQESGFHEQLIGALLPKEEAAAGARAEQVDCLLSENGFDPQQHERFRAELLAGSIGLAKNQLPVDWLVEDAQVGDVTSSSQILPSAVELGEQALRAGEVAIITLAGGVGSRWTQGAGTVKALHPFAPFRGKFRSFIELHLAKSRRSARLWGTRPLHVFSTSYLTHRVIEAALELEGFYGYREHVLLSPSRSIGLRLVPTTRDLLYTWHHQVHQQLELRKQKALDSSRKGLLDWVGASGEASDYLDNTAAQCVHPLGHWYEVANLLLNGTLLKLKQQNPGLKYLMLQNLDTLGANLDPAWLGQHIAANHELSFEVMQRRFEDKGGGLARVAGRLRLVEGLAFANDEDEAKLSYYNSLTTWISVDALLRLFGINWESLEDKAKVRSSVRALAARVPTYVTLKEVKRRWGKAQEDVLLVAQFEKLWGDMSALELAKVGYFDVPRVRGQQLKDVAQLDSWVRDGSKAYVEGLCDF